MQNCVPAAPASATYNAPSGPKRRPRGLFNPVAKYSVPAGAGGAAPTGVAPTTGEAAATGDASCAAPIRARVASGPASKPPARLARKARRFIADLPSRVRPGPADVNAVRSMVP